MKFKNFILAIMALSLCSTCFAVQFMGGEGLFYTQKATVNQPRQFNLTLYQRINSTSGDEGPDRHLVTAFNANYGISERFQIGIIQLLYQDVLQLYPTENKSQIPGDTYFHLKMGGFKFNLGEKPLFFALNFSTNYRTGKEHMVYLEPYTEGAIEGHLYFLFSYFWNPEYVEESSSLHFNLGYINHNDDEESVLASTQEIPFAVAFAKSDLKKEYSLEGHGTVFVDRAYSFGYSYTHHFYLCPGFKYKFNSGINLGVALEVLVYSQKATEFELPFDLPQYSTWRLNIAITGLFNAKRYASPTHIQKLNTTKSDCLSAEELLKEKQSEREEWQKKLDDKQKELEQKKKEKEELQNRFKK